MAAIAGNSNLNVIFNATAGCLRLHDAISRIQDLQINDLDGKEVQLTAQELLDLIDSVQNDVDIALCATFTERLRNNSTSETVSLNSKAENPISSPKNAALKSVCGNTASEDLPAVESSKKAVASELPLVTFAGERLTWPSDVRYEELKCGDIKVYVNKPVIDPDLMKLFHFSGTLLDDMPKRNNLNPQASSSEVVDGLRPNQMILLSIEGEEPGSQFHRAVALNSRKAWKLDDGILTKLRPGSARQMSKGNCSIPPYAQLFIRRGL
ncbi:unnamed protein product [Notodromas monacha]|uniref:Uncharacterized protein n=1 Tax=Notodromas monacha TaxID=399045 RepID=A0A7R9GFD2_9CRUS|nr:unnamed protein product [Notodromas monacha]CAG0920578.1 unnamed protein product [Notodromas monacha]